MYTVYHSLHKKAEINPIQEQKGTIVYSNTIVSLRERERQGQERERDRFPRFFFAVRNDNIRQAKHLDRIERSRVMRLRWINS